MSEMLVKCVPARMKRWPRSLLAAVVLKIRLHDDHLLDRHRILQVQLADSDHNQNGNDSNPYLQLRASIISQHQAGFSVHGECLQLALPAGLLTLS